MLRLRHSLPNFTAGLLTCLCSLSVSFPGAAGDLPLPAATDTETPPAGTPAIEEALRQLKEQQASTFQALDLIRKQTESALQHNTSVLSNQFAQFSTALAGSSERQLQFMRDTERRTLYVTMLILLAVLLGVAALVLLAARTFHSLAKRLPLPAPAASRPELPPGRANGPAALLDQAATSAYSAALLEVETRIAALERRPMPVLSSTPAAPAPERRNPPSAARAPAAAKSGASPLALALGDGQAIVFLPRERRSGAAGRMGELLHRIGRIFSPRKSPAPAKPLPRPRPV
jgi:hypothetical protein